MIRKYICVLLMLIVSHYASAQQSSLSGIKAQLDAMFAGLDKTKVSTGYLWDAAVNLIEAEFYNGGALTDSNYVSLPLMGDLLSSINSASVGADTICVEAALSRIQRLSSSDNMMVGVLYKPYNYIVEDAQTNNLINYSNGVVFDAYKNGVWQNPYGTDVLFAYAMGNDGIVSQNVTYTFANVDSLLVIPYLSLQFDPGDGNGYRNLSPNSTLTLNYQECGYKETILKMTVGGHVYQGHCMVCVVSSSNSSNNGQAFIPTIDSLTFSAFYEGIPYRARVTHMDSVSFRKRPLIVSEGFDPWKLMNEKKTHSYSGSTDLLSIVEATNPADNTRLFDDYDVFYIDWYDYGADIRANAEVLKAVIRWVNCRNRSGEPNIVLGQSMGGLIARYALRDMELNDEVHNTTLFVSHDVPHLGANVSPGLLYFYWDLRQVTEYVLPIYDFIVSLFHDSNISEVNNLGYYQSVRQMLPLYMDSTWTYNSTEYDSLMEELSEMGFPKGDAGSSIENVAIVNGGNFNSTNWYVDGNKLFHYQNQFSFATLSFFYQFFRALFNNDLAGFNEQTPGISTLDFQWSVYPYLCNNSTMYSVSLTLKKRYRWRSPESFSLYSKVRNTPSSGIPLDAVSSSYYFIQNNPMIVDWSLQDYFALRLGCASRIPFIPTASSMVMPNGYNRDFYYNQPIAGEETPFTSYILQNTCSEHIDFYSGISNWLETVTQAEISCPVLVLGGETATLSGNTHNYSCTWTATSPLSINSSTGQIDTTGNGVSTLKVTCKSGGATITKTKRVLKGLPQMTLSVSKNADGSYRVLATPVDYPSRKLVKEAVSDSLMSYVWGIKEGLSDIVWQSASISDTLHVTASTLPRDIIVLLKVRGWNGAESSPVFINVESTIRFFSNLSSVFFPMDSEVEYTLFPVWPELTTEYGHQCLVLFDWDHDQFPFEPTSITLDTYTYPLTEKRTMLDGTVGFVFDVLYDSTFQDVFYDGHVSPFGSGIKSLYVNTNLGVYQEIFVFYSIEYPGIH